jgi:cell division protein FtsI (penicillin-binding protein 3)
VTRQAQDNHQPLWRLTLVFLVIAGLCGIIGWKVADLQVFDNATLQREGDARTVRTDVVVATRGNIVDRNGEPLAISTPVQSLWLNPKEVLAHPEQGAALAEAMTGIGVDAALLNQRIAENASREFLYVKRRLPPAEAQSVLNLGLHGVYAQEEYQRFYPMGEAAVHLIGLTNADDVGQEGLELAYEAWLRGTNGSREVLRDRVGRIIREVQVDSIAQPGNDLTLSIDSRIQYIAYKALKEAVALRHASAGTATVLDAQTGEVLAMVNQPSFNPNNRGSLRDGDLPNRAITSLLEPGSTVKTFTLTAALESGQFDTQTIIETRPFVVDRTPIRDAADYGPSTLARILAKSSQVGAARIGLALGEGPMLDMLALVKASAPVFRARNQVSCPIVRAGQGPKLQRWPMAMVSR